MCQWLVRQTRKCRSIVHIVILHKDKRKNSDYIDNILRDGAGRADEIARPIMRKTYDIMGFL